MVAENMQIGKLEAMKVLQIGAGPSDRGICELVHSALNRRLIREDGAAQMTLFVILTAAVASERQHEQSSVARRNLLELITAETPMTGERKIELHKFIDYPLDLALCFGKFAMQLAIEQPNEGYEEMVALFEQTACHILNECNTEDEVELILRQSSVHRRAHCRKLLNSSRDLMEYSLKPPYMDQFVSNRKYAAYAEDLWRKHQVTEVAGLVESEHTRRWRDNAEAWVRPMVTEMTYGTIILKLIVWLIVASAVIHATDSWSIVATNPKNTFSFVMASLVIAGVPGSIRWAGWIIGLPLWFLVLWLGRIWLYFRPEKATNWSCINEKNNILKQIFVLVHATWRVPVVTCGTWIAFHMLQLWSPVTPR